MFIPEFWVGFGCCLVTEVVLVVVAALISSIKGNMTVKVTQDEEDKS